MNSESKKPGHRAGFLHFTNLPVAGFVQRKFGIFDGSASYQ